MRRHPQRQHGFTLIELMISIAVGLFLVGGLLTILQNIGKTRTNQTLLTQLQDNQRLAMTMITDVIQSAGYFPDPTTYTSLTALPGETVGGTTFVAGQALSGTRVATDPGDTIVARFYTLSGDTIVNCVGGTNASLGPLGYVNKFSVTADGKLACALDAEAATPLVDGLKRMDVWYGVKKSFAIDNNNVDSYLTADQMVAPADWSNVSSVKVRLTFANPLYPQPGQATTIQFTRIIAVMSRTGVKS